MKKQLAITGLFGVLVAFGTLPARAFVSQQSQAVVAQAAVGGTRSANFTLTLHPIASTATTVTQIAWTGALPGGGWKIADNVMQLDWNVSDVNGGIQIYTDNTNGAAVPRFVDPTPSVGYNADSNPAGLLQGAAGTSNATLPVAWSIKASTAVVGTNLLPADPNGGLENGPANKYQWLYLTDKATPAIDRNGDGDVLDTDPILNPDPTLRDTTAFANGDTNPFVNVAKHSGIHGAQGPLDFFADGDRHSFVYLQADFTTAAAATTYRTSRLVVEAYIQ